jgi:hypothetical protein
VLTAIVISAGGFAFVLSLLYIISDALQDQRQRRSERSQELMNTWLAYLLPLLIPFAGVPLTLALRKRRDPIHALRWDLMLAALGFTLGLLRAVLTTDQPVSLQMGLPGKPHSGSPSPPTRWASSCC